MNYYIEGCPIKFHDLLEIFDFLMNLPPFLIYQYDGLLICCNDHRLMWIRVFYNSSFYYVTYLNYPK